MRVKPKIAVQTIDTAGTREALSATPILTTALVITADKTNTGYVYIGDSTVDSTNGQQLAAGESIAFEGEQRSGGVADVDLADFYVDTATSGNKIRIIYYIRA